MNTKHSNQKLFYKTFCKYTKKNDDKNKIKNAC